MRKSLPSEKSFSESLQDLARDLPPEGLNLGEILQKLGTRGSPMLCMILTVPFLLPVSIPGSSAPFGLVIALLAARNIVKKSPAKIKRGQAAQLPVPFFPKLPRKLMNYRISEERLRSLLNKGARFFARIERLTHPRLSVLTHKDTVSRFNCLVMAFTGILLMSPLPLPFSNTLPAYGVLFLAVGELERDGYAVLLGYTMTVATVIYFSAIWIFGVTGLKALS